MIITDKRPNNVQIGDLPIGQYYLRGDLFGKSLCRRIDAKHAYSVETGQPFEIVDLKDTVTPVMCEIVINETGIDPDLPLRKRPPQS